MQKKISNMMSYIFLAVAVLFCSILGGVAFSGCGEQIGGGKNIILMIGDGMGENHIKCAEIDYGHTLNIRSLTYTGYVETASKSVEESLKNATDSAAAATAMATGNRVYNSSIAIDVDGNELTSITQIAKEMGYGVGIVVTDSLCGATPAGFSAHESNRYNHAEIRQDQYNSGIDLFLGADFDESNIENYYAQEKSTIESKGYTFVDSFSKLNLNSEKILGAFNSCPAKDGDDENPTLSQMSQFAVEYMEKHFPDGYFLMIEGSHIDKISHSWEVKNETLHMVEYLVDFDRSIGIAQKALRDSKDDYQLIVTADHETGAMALSKSLQVYCYYSHQHTNWNVPYFIETSGDFGLEDIIKNTDIFYFMDNFYKGKSEEKED